MLNRFALSFIIALGTIPLCFAKNQGYYLPLVGYSRIWCNNTSKALQGGQLGAIGYAFSKDFRIEIKGIGYVEKIILLIETPIISTPKKSQSSKTPENYNQFTTVLKTAPNSFVTSPANAELTQENSTPPQSPIRLFNFEENPNPWNSPTPIKKDRKEDREAFSSQFDMTHQTPKTPTPVSRASQATFAAEEPIALESNLTETKQLTLFWGGLSLANKWTFLHLSPNFRLYWGPGVTALLTATKELSANYFFTLNIGLHQTITSTLSMDCSFSKLFKLKGNPLEANTFFAKKDSVSFALQFNWQL